MERVAAPAALKYQLIASLVIGGLGGICVGSVLGFSAILLPQLPPSVTLSDKSWIASICNIGQLFGALLSGFVSNHVGRKKCLILFTIPLICGWVLIIFTYQNTYLVNIGRILQGFGMMPSVCQVYLTEMLDVKRRDTLGTILAVFISIGITLVYSFGAIFHWQIVSWIFIGLAFAMIVGLAYIPESPHWLVQKGYRDEAVQALQWLRGPDFDITEEMNDLETALKTNCEKTEVGQNSTCSMIAELRKPEVYKPLTILISLWTFQQFSGNYAVIFYAVDVFKGITHVMHDMMEATGSNYISAIMVGSIRILGSIFGVILLKRKVSRKLLMLVSSIGMTVSMASLAVIEHFKAVLEGDQSDHLHHDILQQNLTEHLHHEHHGHHGHHHEEDDGNLLITVLLVVATSGFILSHGIGFNIIPMLLVGELCPVRLKSLTSGLTITVVAILVFSVVKMFPIAVATMGGHYTYGFFALVCLSGAVFSYFFVPETRGKTVDELQEMYSK